MTESTEARRRAKPPQPKPPLLPPLLARTLAFAIPKLMVAWSIRSARGWSRCWSCHGGDALDDKKPEHRRQARMNPDRRPIDRIRESAGQMRIGDPGDETRITGFFKIGDDRLFILKSGGVYEILMADQIDPERQNIDVPNVQQRVLTVGTDDPIVGCTIQLAEVILSPEKLAAGLDISRAKAHCLEAAKHLAAMRASALQIASHEKVGIEAVAAAKVENRGLAMPSVPALRATVSAYVQSGDHCLQQLLGLVEVFYGAGARKSWFESFANMTAARYGADDPLATICADTLPFLQFIRKARNCVEHEKNNERLIARDFRLNSEATVVPPTIEVIHPHFPLSETLLSNFTSEVTDKMATVFANFLAAMSQKHVVPQGAFAIAVGIDEKPLKDQEHVPYRYYIEINGGWMPLN